jgi:hypothetical protein
MNPRARPIRSDAKVWLAGKLDATSQSCRRPLLRDASLFSRTFVESLDKAPDACGRAFDLGHQLRAIANVTATRDQPEWEREPCPSLLLGEKPTSFQPAWGRNGPAQPDIMPLRPDIGGGVRCASRKTA